jgi:hypothetical protein
MTDEHDTQDEKAVTKPARVAIVVDPYTIVLNVGRNDGITPKQSFLVYGHGPDVTDPETGDNLGPLEIVRGRGQVDHLQDSVCTLVSTMTRNVPGIKKIYRRDRFGGISSYLGNQFDEIEEGASTVTDPFKDATVGDYARPL